MVDQFGTAGVYQCLAFALPPLSGPCHAFPLLPSLAVCPGAGPADFHLHTRSVSQDRPKGLVSLLHCSVHYFQ